MIVNTFKLLALVALLLINNCSAPDSTDDVITDRIVPGPRPQARLCTNFELSNGTRLESSANQMSDVTCLAKSS